MPDPEIPACAVCGQPRSIGSASLCRRCYEQRARKRAARNRPTSVVVLLDTSDDVAYLTLGPKAPLDRRGIVAECVEVGEELVVDLDQDGHVVGIEFLAAGRQLLGRK